MKIKMISEFGNEIKIVTDYAQRDRLLSLGWTVEETTSANLAKTQKSAEAEKPGEAAPKTAKKPRTRTVKTNGK